MMNNPLRTLIALFALTLGSATTLANPPATFTAAKKVLAKEIYKGHQVTFYCGCKYAEAINPATQGKTRLTPDPASCGLRARKNPDRAARIEWEHIVPAWEFGHQLQCWQNGGRKACANDPRFNAMEADMRNLVPAVGELNGDRGNFRYGMIEGEPRAYGACDFEVDFKAKVAEPAPSIRGDIARTYFYFANKYDLQISPKQRKLFEAWNKEDPEDQWEKERIRRIENANKRK